MCIVLYHNRDGEWIKRALGNGYGSPNHFWRILHGSHGRDGDGHEAPDSVYGTNFVPISLLMSNTQLEKVKQFAKAGWIKYMVNPATIKYNKRTGKIDQNLEDSKENDEVSV